MSDTSTIALRPFQSSDVPFFTRLAGDSRVTCFVGNGEPWDEEAITARVGMALNQAPLQHVGAVRWFIAENSLGEVGLVVSSRTGSGVEIGYWVSPEHWGRGIAGAMIDQALVAIPHLYGMSSLSARVDPENVASARVLARRGFTLGRREDGLDQYIRALLTT